MAGEMTVGNSNSAGSLLPVCHPLHQSTQSTPPEPENVKSTTYNEVHRETALDSNCKQSRPRCWLHFPLTPSCLLVLLCWFCLALSVPLGVHPGRLSCLPASCCVALCRLPSTLISFGLFSLGGVRAEWMWPSPSSISSGQPQPQPAQLQPHRIRASLREERLMEQVQELSDELQLIKSEACTLGPLSPLPRCVHSESV